MTYNNCDDSQVSIPREMFELRQRQLSEITCVKRKSKHDALGAKTRRELGTKIRNRTKKGEQGQVKKVKIYLLKNVYFYIYSINID